MSHVRRNARTRALHATDASNYRRRRPAWWFGEPSTLADQRTALAAESRCERAELNTASASR
jgi:hypothetical protein